MIPALLVFAYLGVVLYVGIFAFRRKGRTAAGGSSSAGGRVEEYFLAGRSLGTLVFFLSFFGTNMTAFAILGSSGHAFANGIVTYPLMASSSALVVPVCLFLIGTRVWALGRRYGFITPVQMFRDRWECSHIGTAIFVVQAALLVPYIIIGVVGGGATLRAVSGGLIPSWFGGAVVAIVVMSYVFFGGMRGTAFVNTLQTLLFLTFGAIAMWVISSGMGGFREAAESLLASDSTASLLTRERVDPLYFFGYMFIPLSTITFPHISIFCLTARSLVQFRKTVIIYPFCMIALWVPCVYLGVMANRATEVPAIEAKLEARTRLAEEGPRLTPEARNTLRAQATGDDVMLLMLDYYAPVWLAGLLGAGIMAAVMASDSQLLALSTMFTEDVFAFYGGKERFGEAVQVQMGRVFVVILTAVAYFIAQSVPVTIFSLATQFAFAGFSAMFPLLVAALFWRKSTKWGALASTAWVAASVTAIALFQSLVPAPAPGQIGHVWSVAGIDVLTRTSDGAAMFGLLPVVSMTLISGALMGIVSLITAPPSARTLNRYFGE